ncbi:MAG: hypothetical protein ACTHOG_07870 [Marmoricola sp.]
MLYPYFTHSSYSAGGYTLWLVVTTVLLVALLFFGVRLATGNGWRRHGPPKASGEETHGEFE